MAAHPYQSDTNITLCFCATDSFPMDQWIIGTDYTSYLVVYGCTIVNEVTGECDHPAAWVWSRTQTLPDDARDAVEVLLPSICVTFDDMKKMPIGEGT